MSNISNTLNGAIGSALPLPDRGRFGGWVATLLQRGRDRARILRDYELLMDMPDHILKDVGLNRYRLASERRKYRYDLIWSIWR